MRTARRRVFAMALAGSFLAGAALGQPEIRRHTEIGFDTPEAWAMKYFASVTLPTAFGVPRSRPTGRLEAALEYVQVPSLDEDQRRVGFGGAKVEDLNKVPYLLRPVLRVGLGGRFTLAAGWVPPVEWNGAEPNILSLALERPLLETERWRIGLRLHGQTGDVEGDFTCSRQTVAGGSDPAVNPFGCEVPSRDEYDLGTVGLEASASLSLGAEGRWEPFAAVSYNAMDLEFRLDARYSGVIDRSRLSTDGETVYALAGLSYRAGERWRLAGEAFYSPLDVVRPPATGSDSDELLNVRALVAYSFD